MKRRSFLKLGAGALMGPGLGAGLSACGGNGDSAGDSRGGDPAGDPGGEPGAPPPGPPVSPPEPRNTVAGWTGVALQAVRDARPGPPMAARSLAIMYTCMYNAWCAYDPVAQPTRPPLAPRRPLAECTAPNRALAMNHAAHVALLDQFPGQRATFDAWMKRLGYDRGADASGAGALGSAVARIEIEYCHADGANQLGDLAPGGVPYADYTGYAPKNPPMLVNLPTMREGIPAPGHWQPLTFIDATGVPRTLIFVAAAWEKVRPFALASSDQYRPGPPPAFGSPEYVEEVRRIVEVQAALTDRQKVIVDHWADIAGSELPPGHWVRIGLYVSERDRHTDDEDIKMFLALSNALGDAAIAAWDAKRAYDSARPITAVRYLMSGQDMRGYGLPDPAAGLRTIRGEIWIPYQPMSFPTPPFPEYVSGHSCFSAAAAEVLRSFTGSDDFGASQTVAAHSVPIEPAVPASELTLSWPTFSAAAEEAGVSRIYGGIHFDHGNTAGQLLGRRAGARAFARAQGLWLGAA